jgi:hypothetical protein
MNGISCIMNHWSGINKDKLLDKIVIKIITSNLKYSLIYNTLDFYNLIVYPKISPLNNNYGFTQDT